MFKSQLLAPLYFGLLILSACGQNNSDSQTVEQLSEIDRAILAGELSTGDWIEKSRDNEEVLMFGMNQTEPKLSFRCNLTTKKIFVEKDEYIPDKNQVQVKFILPTGSKNYQATVENHGLPAIRFAFDTADPFLEKLAATEDRFAILPEVGKQLLIPTSPKIKELLAQCS